jgi:TRAP-type C4-dicarboxylate transport system permease large subunit
MKTKSKRIVDPDEILLSAAAATIPCVLFDYLLVSLQNWQRERSGTATSVGLGTLGRTLVSILVNFAMCLLITYVYTTVGHDPQDAFLVGALMWLMVSVPALFTSRYVDESQRQFLAGRILGWLAKTAIAAAAAAYFITFRS